MVQHRSVATWAVIGVLGGCAQTAPPKDQTPASAPVTAAALGQRVNVLTVADWPSTEALTARIGAIAGVPVRDAVGTTPRRISVTLECADTEACDKAIERLSAERSVIVEATPDRLRRLPARPPRTQSP